MASFANCILSVIFPFNAYNVFSRPTVNDELDPSPDLAGRSASWWISKPELITEDKLDDLILSSSSTVHDYDLGFQLKYLKKLNKIGKVYIIGIPKDAEPDYDSIQSIFKKLVAQDMQGS